MEFDTGRLVSCYEYKFTKEVLFETTFNRRRMLRWQSKESYRSYSLGYSFYNSLRVLIEHNRATSLLTNTCSVTSTFNFTLDVCIVDQVVSDPSLTLTKPCSSRWETRFGNVDIVYDGVSNWEAHKIYHTNFDIYNFIFQIQQFFSKHFWR